MAKYTWSPMESMIMSDGTCLGYKTETECFYLNIVQLTIDAFWVYAQPKTHIADRLDPKARAVAYCKSLTSAKRWVARHY